MGRSPQLNVFKTYRKRDIFYHRPSNNLTDFIHRKYIRYYLSCMIANKTFSGKMKMSHCFFHSNKIYFASKHKRKGHFILVSSYMCFK